MFSGWLGGSEAPLEWKYDDLPTPKSDEEYKEEAAKAIAVRLEWADSKDGWEEIQRERGVVLEQRELPGSWIHLVRARALLRNIEVEDIIRLTYDADLKERKTLIDDITNHEVIEEIVPGELHVAHSQFSAPMGVTNREFVAIRTRKTLDDGRIIVAIQSVNVEGRPFSPGFVRGSSNSCLVVEKTKDKQGNDVVRVVTVDHIGMLPRAPPSAACALIRRTASTRDSRTN